jgi:methionine biosynthesis protein MetW
MAQLELVHPAELRAEAKAPPRADHVVIAQMVQDKAWALDVGCGDGALMSLLRSECGARVRGLEHDRTLAHKCVSRGLSVVQGDAETELSEFPSASFDYVIFSRTLQHLRRPFAALKEAGRVGERVIVSIGNAGHWSPRMRLILRGQLGEADVLHRFTVRDFAQQARALRFGIERAVPLSRSRQGAPFAKTLWRANWFAEEAVFLLAP